MLINEDTKEEVKKKSVSNQNDVCTTYLERKIEKKKTAEGRKPFLYVLREIECKYRNIIVRCYFTEDHVQ